MVSLNTQHGRTGGGISFDDRSLNGADEIPHEDTPLIDSQEQPYRAIRTTGIIILHIILTILFLGAIIIFPALRYLPDQRYPNFICPNATNLDQCKDEYSPYHIALGVHALSYIVAIIFDRIYHYYQDVSRQNGYLEFYRRTRNLRRTPLFVISTGNALLVGIIEIFEYYLIKIRGQNIDPWYFLAGLSAIELIVILIALFTYLGRTIKFNRERARPDAAQEEMLSTFITTESTANEIGYRDETFKESVLEKQGDLIRYLRERNEHLSRLVLQYKQEADYHHVIPNRNL